MNDWASAYAACITYVIYDIIMMGIYIKEYDISLLINNVLKSHKSSPMTHVFTVNDLRNRLL